MTSRYWSPDPGVMRRELEEHNRLQLNEPDAEWAIAELLPWLPVDAAVKAWAGMARGLRRAGYDAFFREETGLRVLWIRRRRKDAAQ